MDIQTRLSAIEQRLAAQEARRMTQRDYVNRSVKQRHLEGMVIFTGLAADLPTGQTDVKAYFATDTDELYIFNTESEAWVSVTLS